MLKPSTQFSTRAVPYQWYMRLANFNMYMCMCEYVVLRHVMLHRRNTKNMS